MSKFECLQLVVGFFCNLAMDVFGLVVVLRPGQQFFSHAGTEPQLPG